MNAGPYKLQIVFRCIQEHQKRSQPAKGNVLNSVHAWSLLLTFKTKMKSFPKISGGSLGENESPRAQVRPAGDAESQAREPMHHREGSLE